jgi:outer membrane protein assembly factor BamB
MYVISTSNDIAAVLKRDGSIRWATPLETDPKGNPNTTAQKAYYGPILSANAILVMGGDGTLTSYKPTTGEKIGSIDLASDIVTSPIVANGAMYVMTKGATLYKYY